MPEHPNPEPLKNIPADQIAEKVQDYYDSGANSVCTWQEADGSYTLLAKFDGTPALQPGANYPGLLATATTSQTLARAHSCLGLNTTYDMVPTDNDPSQPFPKSCDCSGFVDWAMGSWRQLPPKSDRWLYTDSIWAGGGEAGDGLFAKVPKGDVAVGDFYVYPSPDSNHKGHIAIITAVAGSQPTQIVHCSQSNYHDTNDAVRETGPHVFEANERSRIVRPDYDMIRRYSIIKASTPSEGEKPVPISSTTLSWDDVEERKAWSAQLLSSIDDHIKELEDGKPDNFISGYSDLTPDRRRKFWGELFVAIAIPESSWNRKSRYYEGHGVYSIGLLQLSIQDQDTYHLTPRIQSQDELETASINLKWAVQIFAKRLHSDGVVATGTRDNPDGAAKYWSTLQEGHINDVDGKKQETKPYIIKRVQKLVGL